METKRQSRTPLLASVVLVVIIAAAFGYYYVTASAQISSLNSSISSQQSVIGVQSGSLSSQSATIQSQSASIGSLQGSVAALQANATAYRSLVASLNAMISSDKAQVASLTSKLTSANATIASDKAMITGLNAQIVTANAMIANLTTTVNLQASKVLVSGMSVTIYGTTHRSSTPFVTFSPKYAGYVLLTATAATEAFFGNSTSKPTVGNSGGGVFDNWNFLAPSSATNINYFLVAVSPGTLNSFALLTNLATDGTATVTVTYYY